MGISRYTASADNTIVNAYQLDLKTRGSGANAGASDILETFSIYGRITSASQELSRILIKFPVSSISADRTAGTLPASGNVNFYLRMFNAPHSRTTPIEYVTAIEAITQDWEEGIGLDLVGYKDLNKNNIGSDWVQRKKDATWTNVGGTYKDEADYQYKQTFSTGLEDLEVNITPLVERWIAGDQTNYGVGVHMSASYEASASESYVGTDSNVILNSDGAKKSYYTKRFFARGTQYFFKRPIIEARWDSTLKDDRGNSFFSSSRATGADNLNKIYFYNLVRGRLTNLPGIGSNYGTYDSWLRVSLFSGSTDNSEPSGSAVFLHNTSTQVLAVTGGYVSTGIYSCSVCFTQSSNLKTLYDVWFSGSNSITSATTATKQFFTGTINPQSIDTGVTSLEPTYYINLTNLKNSYSRHEKARLNLYARERNWSPTIYNVANKTADTLSIRSASYAVVRLIDNQVVIPYGTGSEKHTHLSYNVSGNYFDFDMSLLEKGYAYAFKFSFYDDRLNSWTEHSDKFKFRVQES
mgnify:CR=1 FL=1